MVTCKKTSYDKIKTVDIA